MGSKQTTTSQQQSNLQYTPQSQSDYNRLTGAGTNYITSYLNNPFKNQMFALSQQFGQQGANKLGQQNINAFNQNYLTSGFGGNAGAAFKAAQMGQIGRSNQALRSQANLQGIYQALGRQQSMAPLAMSFQPLMTGTSSQGQSTQSTSGLGTWLPQLAGGLMSAAMMAGTGGMSGAAGARGSSVAGGLPASATMPISPLAIPSNGFGSMPNIGAGFSPGMPSINPLTMSSSGGSGFQWGY